MNATSDGRAVKRRAVKINADGPSSVPSEEPEIRSELRICLGEMGEDDLKRMVLESHRHYEQTLRQAVRVYARQAGLALLEMKRRVGHGGWGRWMKDHLDFSSETANVYMRVASRWDDIVAVGLNRDGVTLEHLREFTSKNTKAGDGSEPPTGELAPDDDGEADPELTPANAPARKGTDPTQFRLVLPYNLFRPFIVQLDALAKRLKQSKEDILLSLVQDAYKRQVEGGAE